MSDSFSIAIYGTNGTNAAIRSRLISGMLFRLIRLHVKPAAAADLNDSKIGIGHFDMSVVVIFLPQKLNEECAHIVAEVTSSNSFEP